MVEHYLGFPVRDWDAPFGEWNDKRLAVGVAALDAATAGEHEHTTPSLPLAQYAARYVDNWYGPIAITHDGQANGLRIDFLQSPNMARSEEHTSELQSLMRISYAVFCLKKKKQTNDITCRKPPRHINKE